MLRPAMAFDLNFSGPYEQVCRSLYNKGLHWPI